MVLGLCLPPFPTLTSHKGVPVPAVLLTQLPANGTRKVAEGHLNTWALTFARYDQIWNEILSVKDSLSLPFKSIHFCIKGNTCCQMDLQDFHFDQKNLKYACLWIFKKFMKKLRMVSKTFMSKQTDPLAPFSKNFLKAPLDELKS